jgi:hypothetical protein
MIAKNWGLPTLSQGVQSVPENALPFDAARTGRAVLIFSNRLFPALTRGVITPWREPGDASVGAV